MSRRACVATLLLLLGAPPTARGQVFAGGEQENYLRYLQTLQAVPLYPWGLRAFSPIELDRLQPSDTSLPWRVPPFPRAFTWLDPGASARVNTAFPYGYNDGPLWAGRGVTLAVDGGFAVRRGALALTVAPLVFVAQNAGFTLMPNGRTGHLVFADGFSPRTIDRPQRFGDNAYARVDPGQSTLRLDWRKLAVGLTTANQYWGPATDFPVMLGNNAPGFPQAFVGTSRPIDLWVVRLHGRLVWGRLAESAFSPETSATRVRLASGLIVALTPRWVPGLELGVTRFSHRRWPRGGLSFDDLLGMFRGGQGGEVNARSENQLASAFFRWVFPNSGFEVYGEYGRNDYNIDIRDFVGEPDHSGGYTIGFRKATRRADRRILAVRVELNNLQASRLAESRRQPAYYTHGGVRQGHTQVGQVLGGPAIAGHVAAVESYSTKGRWTWAWTRLLRQQRGDSSGTVPDPKGVDVQHALSVERLAFRDRYGIVARATAVYELNRDFSRDAFNLNLVIGLRWKLGARSREPYE